MRVREGELINFDVNRGIFIRGDKIYNGSKEISLDHLMGFDDLKVIIATDGEQKLMETVRKMLGVLIINEHRNEPA